MAVLKDNLFHLNDDILTSSLFSFCSPAENLEPREDFDVVLIKAGVNMNRCEI